ncbi:MAG: DMT family transporter [Yoonia sp.]|uniref:DMT family transporter n=1 Tax=Yoonia sp. TaxID=2212373 RepID=UPI0021FE37E9|nr:DMT family transporter [Rhodobacteraceae bacterium S2214]
MHNSYLIMLAAGIGVPVLAALNAALGRTIGSPAVAAATLFLVAFASAAIVALLTAPQAAAKIATAPKHLLLGGVLIAFYVLSITWIAPVIGVGNAVFLVLIGQMIAAATIDHFGLFGANVAPLNATRAAGICVMAAGVFITQKA